MNDHKSTKFGTFLSFSINEVRIAKKWLGFIDIQIEHLEGSLGFYKYATI